MTDHSDYMDIQKLLAELPEITLPDSLRTDVLFACMDAQSATDTTPAPATKHSNIIDLTRRLRPVLSYAAVFAVLVLVYYGTGVDKSGMSPAPKAAPQMMMAADSASSSAAATTDEGEAATTDEGEAAPANEMAAAPQMAAAPMPSTSEGGGDNTESKTTPRMATAGVVDELVAEHDFGELRAMVHQRDSSVMIKLVRISDPTTILRTIVQDGSYSYMGEVGSGETAQLIVATLTATNTHPTMQLDGEPQGDIANLHRYTTSDHDQYMVFTVVSGGDNATCDTAAVQGSNLILQTVGDSNFVVFSDAKPDAVAVDSIRLGNATIELR